MSLVQAVILAILQGVTELFPVSSLGHAVVLPSLLGWNVDQSSVAFLPFLVVLHLGYAWLAVGLCLLGLSGLVGSPPPSSALHALTAGAIGTMTLAVMTRTSLSQTGRRAVPVRGTAAIYVLITAAAVARVLAPMLGGEMDPLLSLAGIAWCAAFGWFALLYGRVLATGRPTRRASPGRHGVSSSAPGTG